MRDETLLSIDQHGPTTVSAVELASVPYAEADLQRWVIATPEIFGPGALIITAEFDEWQAPSGDKVGDRLDILALDTDGRPIVCELKRGFAPSTVHMQAINYAAMVSRLNLRDLAEIHANWLAKRGTKRSADDLETELQTRYTATDESVSKPRIVLIASNFPYQVSTAAIWLKEAGVDITLVRHRAYPTSDGQILVSFTQFWPPPTVEEFAIGRRSGSTAPPSSVDAGIDWDEASLRRLAAVGNDATLALLDLCSQAGDEPVSVLDVQEEAGLSTGQLRGQLAGLTMMLKNARHGFAQTRRPVDVTWLSGGVAAYSMNDDLAALWRRVRSLDEDGRRSDQVALQDELSTAALPAGNATVSPARG